MYEGPTRVAAIIVESVVGTNGVVKPPAGLDVLCVTHVPRLTQYTCAHPFAI